MNPFKVRYREHPFKVGDKVVCVDLSIRDAKGWDHYSERLVLHRVYVIREAEFDDCGTPCVRLVGIFGGPWSCGAERMLVASRFALLSDYRATYAKTMAAKRGIKLEFMPEPEPQPEPEPKKAAKPRRRRPKAAARKTEAPPTDAAKAPRKTITVKLDEEQAGILMNMIESCFNGRKAETRSEAALKEAIDGAVRTWEPGQCSGFEYQVVRVAPVYRQLLAHWHEPNTPLSGCYDTEDRAEFAAAVKEARKPLPSSRSKKGEVHHD